jgi:hypothetical protein
MSYLTDDVARILASPMPRRKAFRLLGGILAGGFLGSIGVKPAHADPGGQQCGFFGFERCNSSQKCCRTGIIPFCVASADTCCGFSGCSSNNSCCGFGIFSSCTTNGASCCGAQACRFNNICCRAQIPFCVSNSNQCPASDRPS